MLRVIARSITLYVLVLLTNRITLAEDSQLASLRRILLREDTSRQDARNPAEYHYGIEADDPRLKAIEQLETAGSAEAVAILREFLTTHNMTYRFKRRALLSLGRIGTKPATQAIREFDSWSKKRFSEPPTFQFGIEDILHTFLPHHVTPLAKTTDERNRTWAIFYWERYGRTDIWLTQAVGKNAWSQPILLNLPRMPELYPYGPPNRKWDEKCSFQVKDGSIKIIVHDTVIQSRISDHLADSDKDGLPNLVEARLLTNRRKPDSDRDGLPDGKDSNPLTPKHSKTYDMTEIRQAVFSVLFATSNSQGAIVIVERGDFAKQEYYGFGGVVLRAAKVRNGFVNIHILEAEIESPTAATAIIGNHGGNMGGGRNEAKLRKINGKWVVIEFKMTGQA